MNIQRRARIALLLATISFSTATIVCEAQQPCPNPTPVDRQFLAHLVQNPNSIGDFHAVATVQPSRTNDLQVEVFGRANGALFKSIVRANGTTIYTQYYDGQFFWHEQRDLLIKARSVGLLPPDSVVSVNPMQLLAQTAPAECEYALCGYEVIAGRNCAMIRVKILAVNEKRVQSIVPGFSGASAAGSTTLTWIDIENGFPYKTQMYDPNGQLVSNVTFANVQFQPVPTSTFTPAAGTRTVTEMSLPEFYSERGKAAIATEILNHINNQ